MEFVDDDDDDLSHVNCTSVVFEQFAICTNIHVVPPVSGYEKLI